MTKKEYDRLNAVRIDSLGHIIREGDTVAFNTYDRRVEVGKIIKICDKRVIVQLLNTEYRWIYQLYPKDLLKINLDAIPQN